MAESIVVGKRGVLTLPAQLRRRYSIEEGTILLLDEVREGLLLRPAVSVPIEIYSDERIEEFLAEDRLKGPGRRRSRGTRSRGSRRR